MSEAYTVAPSSDIAIALALPIPIPAAVMKMFLFFNLFIGTSNVGDTDLRPSI